MSKSVKKGARDMKRLIVVLAAFLLQSCYTVMYGSFDDHSSTIIEYAPPSPDPNPVYFPPQPAYAPPVSMPATNSPQPARPRTGGSTREPANNSPVTPAPARERATPQPAGSGQSQQPRKGNQNAGPDQGGERQRANSQPSQSTPQRPR